MPRRFDAVLFDFGGVFIESPFSALEEAALGIGADPGQLLRLLFGPYEEDTDHPWHRLERGELPLLEVREQLIALGRQAGIDADPFQLLAAAMLPKSRPKQEVVRCVRELRRDGYRTGMLTNNVREVRGRWRAILPVEELFDVVVDSSEVGMRKPDPAIYRKALDLLGGVAPHRSIFLDDVQSNVDAAEGIGMRGILVEADPRGALSELRSMLRDG